jgi:hypothetical protein
MAARVGGTNGRRPERGEAALEVAGHGQLTSSSIERPLAAGNAQDGSSKYMQASVHVHRSRFTGKRRVHAWTSMERNMLLKSGCSDLEPTNRLVPC